MADALVVVVRQSYTCSQIRAHLQKFVKRPGFPDLAPEEAFFDLTGCSIEHWEQPLLAYLEDIDGALKSLIAQLIDEVFADCQRTELVRVVSDVLGQLADRILDQQNSQARWLLECELSPQGTLDVEGQRMAETESTRNLRKEAAEARANNFLNESETENRRTTGAEREDAVKRKIASLKDTPLPYLREIAAVGKIQSHYRLAMNRFMDYLLVSGQRHVLEDFAEKAFAELREALGLAESDGEFWPHYGFRWFSTRSDGADACYHFLAQDRCARLLAEDPQRERRRAHLLEELRRLHTALQSLARLA